MELVRTLTAIKVTDSRPYMVTKISKSKTFDRSAISKLSVYRKKTPSSWKYELYKDNERISFIYVLSDSISDNHIKGLVKDYEYKYNSVVRF